MPCNGASRRIKKRCNRSMEQESDGMSMYNPHLCGESINIGGIFICKLQAIPCALHKGQQCYLEKIDRAVGEMKELFAEGNKGVTE